VPSLRLEALRDGLEEREYLKIAEQYQGGNALVDACLAGPRAPILASDGLVPPPPAAAADLWSADTPTDLGDEPNNVSATFYESDDIWVRRQQDGLTNQDHENPIYRPGGTPPNYVYVRVRNRACGTAGSGTVKLYWAKASTALGWPAPWDGSVTMPALMGGQIGSKPTGSVPGRGYVILEFPWSPPNPVDYASFGADKVHFCLLSRIETAAASPYGMTSPEGSNLWLNVKNNNNIVWKNVTVAEAGAGGSKVGWVTVGKLVRDDWLMKLVFTEPRERYEPSYAIPQSIFEWGTVDLNLGRELYKRWKAVGSEGWGIKDLGRNRIAILERDAWIGMLKLEPGELFSIGARFRPNQESQPGTYIFYFHVLEYAVAGRKQQVIGGQKFVVKTTPRKA